MFLEPGKLFSEKSDLRDIFDNYYSALLYAINHAFFSHPFRPFFTQMYCKRLKFVFFAQRSKLLNRKGSSSFIPVSDWLLDIYVALVIEIFLVDQHDKGCKCLKISWLVLLLIELETLLTGVRHRHCRLHGNQLPSQVPYRLLEFG